MNTRAKVFSKRDLEAAFQHLEALAERRKAKVPFWRRAVRAFWYIPAVSSKKTWTACWARQ
jgi:molybdopterin synthase catalytic subunit